MVEPGRGQLETAPLLVGRVGGGTAPGHDHGPSPGRTQGGDSVVPLLVGVHGTRHELGEFPVVELHQIRAPGQGRVQPGRRQVHQHRRAGAAGVGDQVGVELRRERVPWQRVGDHQHVGSHGGRHGGREQVVEFVPAHEGAPGGGDRHPVPGASVDDVATAGSRGPDQVRRHGQVGQKRRQRGARLAADGAAQHGCRAQFAAHLGDPHALPARVDMDIVTVAAGSRLDGDRQDRMGSEDRNPRHAHAPSICLTARLGSGWAHGARTDRASRHHHHRRGSVRCRRSLPRDPGTAGQDVRGAGVTAADGRDVGPVPLPGDPLGLRHVHPGVLVRAVDRAQSRSPTATRS